MLILETRSNQFMTAADARIGLDVDNKQEALCTTYF